ncbi:aldose 1-epimerase [Aquimarina amphilecti]|uniref:Aldose 1-epimerase n=1 Tax=Aquimarina amphilecti TaxID=1038014 RepID=A0A1H7K7V5_AQUAM|nr:aldose epimerase family protein [Aquimarina amphilecti]SEK82981.1 aldose 1-epimerase [Aquimarina amphilecti]
MIQDTLYSNNETYTSITLRNNRGSKLTLTNYGASIISLEIPNKREELVNVVVGLDSVNDYKEVSYHPSAKFLGASIGRYAGRISNGDFSISNKVYSLYHKDGVHLHGGSEGFDKKVWDVDFIDYGTNTVGFSYYSRHLEEGYPGNLEVKAIYQLSEDNDLKITYKAISDLDTVVNLTNHAYFNLNGSGSILDHILLLDCFKYLEVNPKQLPTGKEKSVTATKYDFLKPKSLQCLADFGLIDDTLIYSSKKGNSINGKKARLIAPNTGISMEIDTNQPAVVIYTPENLPKWNFKNQSVYNRFPAICFENQNYPDAPNHSHFPSSLIKAGETYESKSVFKFLVI